MKKMLSLIFSVLMVTLLMSINATATTPTEPNLCIGAKIETSSIYNETYAGEMAIDGDLETRWNNVGGNVENPAWFIVDLGSEKVINKAVIYDFAARVASFTLEISTDKTNWTKIHTGERLAPADTPQADKIPCDIDFTAVEARYVRFEASYDAGTSMSIWEFELYNIGNVSLEIPTIIAEPAPTAEPVTPPAVLSTTPAAQTTAVSAPKTSDDFTMIIIMIICVFAGTACISTYKKITARGK